jgi:hypothetical protein
MFKNKLKIEAVEKEDSYLLTSHLSYITNLGDKITVPKHFKTNFASVPRVAKVYIDDDDWQIRAPSVIHDYLYSAESIELGFTRKQADEVLLEAMMGLGMRKTKALLIYFVLRLFGGSNYEKR